ncbi:MAG: AI-2E family transporter [Dehalococcoidia bacterium]|nr:AI-2E family transporter [Dehalococcoidia bacterium]
MRIEISGRGLLIVLAVAAVVWALWQLWSLVLLVLASLILMAALAPAAGWLERRGAPRTLAVLGLLLALLLALAGMFATVAPAVYEEVQDL